MNHRILLMVLAHLQFEDLNIVKQLIRTIFTQCYASESKVQNLSIFGEDVSMFTYS